MAEDESNKRDDDAPVEDAQAEKLPGERAPQTNVPLDAIARRVQALDDESDEAEKLAREEENKLAERRARSRTRSNKGLETAASKKLRDIGSKKKKERERTEERQELSSRAVDADPLIEKTAQLSKWLRRNSKAASYIVLFGLVGLAGYGAFALMTRKKNEAASQELTRAIEAGRGMIGDPEADDEEEKLPVPVFKTADEQREAMLKQYREVETKFPKSGAAILAQLSEASLLLDKGDSEAARRAFESVRDSALAQADVEIRGRALEGLGFALERKAMSQPEQERGGALGQALLAYKALEETGTRGFKQLAQYHQSRVLELRGDKARATELLKKVYEDVTKPGETQPLPFLEAAAEARLRVLDPTAVKEKTPGDLQGFDRGKLSAEMQKQLEQLKKMGQKGHRK